VPQASDAVLVVGGSRGIGKAIADAFPSRAVVWSRGQGVDAADEASVQAAAVSLLAARGAPWALVHAAGDFAEQGLLAGDGAHYDAMVRSNLTSVFHTVRAVVPAMVTARRGRVVLFAAAGAGDERGMTRAPVYFALKAAVLQLGRSLAKEVASAGVTVNTISPGLIWHADSHQQSQQRLRPRVPLGRLGLPDDVVGVVRWLLSEQSSYVTGAQFTVDGGLML
jgi:3-oxoacyl-[acyl-carrier protein] reductase